MEKIIKEALDRYNKLKESGEIPTSTQFYKLFSKRKLSQAFEGGNAWSRLQQLAGDSPTRFSKTKSNLDEVLIEWGTLARNTIKKYDKLPRQSDWEFHKIKPTVSGIENSHKIKWSFIPRLFLEKFQKDPSWDDIVSYISEKFKKIQSSTKKGSEDCFVYLIKDLRNSYYKIGISNDPSIRERTLQSEQPKQKVIAKKRYINRKIAGAIEKALHSTYDHKRKRGEWFALDDEDMKEIMDTLDN